MCVGGCGKIVGHKSGPEISSVLFLLELHVWLALLPVHFAVPPARRPSRG